MSSPERLFHPRHLKSLKKSDVQQLKKEIQRHVRSSPETRKLIKAHEDANKELRKKLAPTLKALKAKGKKGAK
jgi:hypothetical protein